LKRTRRVEIVRYSRHVYVTQDGRETPADDSMTFDVTPNAPPAGTNLTEAVATAAPEPRSKSMVSRLRSFLRRTKKAGGN